MKRLLALLCLMPLAAGAQTYYDKTTIAPNNPPGIVSTSTLTLPGTYSGPGTANQNFIGYNSTLSGSATNAVEFAPYYFYLTSTNFIKSASGKRFMPALEVNHFFGGSGDEGAFAGLAGYVHMTATTGNFGVSFPSNFAAGTFGAFAAANEGGTSGNGNGYGALFGGNPFCELDSGATYWHQCVGEEIDTLVATGAGVEETIGLQIVQKGTDVVSGTIGDIGMSLNNSSGAKGWDCGWCIGNYDGRFSLKSTGTLGGCWTHAATSVGTASCGSTTNGWDLRGITFSGVAYASNGFSVDGSGNLTSVLGTHTGGLAVSGGASTFNAGTALSQATWGLNGLGWIISNATFNDTTTGSGGVTNDAAYAILSPTVTNTQGTANTLTGLYTFYVKQPTCGTGWTACTNKYGIGTDGGIIGTAGLTVTGGSIVLNGNSNNNVNINTGSSTGTTSIGNTAGTGSALTVSAPTTLNLGTSLSQASWTTAGYGLSVPAATYNDTTVGSGGVTTEAAYAFGAPTITNTQGTANTLTNLVNLYLAAPVCGSGWAGCTNLYGLYVNGKALVNGQFTGAVGAVINGGTISLNNGSNNTTNINTGTSNGAVHIGDGSGNNAITIGNGTGLVNMTNMENAAGTTFTVATASGCSGTNGTPGTLAGGSQTGSFVGNSSGTTCSFAITMNGATGATAAHGWYCAGADITSAVNLAQSAKTTATCTLKGTVNATGDTIVFHAYAY